MHLSWTATLKTIEDLLHLLFSSLLFCLFCRWHFAHLSSFLLDKWQLHFFPLYFSQSIKRRQSIYRFVTGARTAVVVVAISFCLPFLRSLDWTFLLLLNWKQTQQWINSQKQSTLSVVVVVVASVRSVHFCAPEIVDCFLLAFLQFQLSLLA